MFMTIQKAVTKILKRMYLSLFSGTVFCNMLRMLNLCVCVCVCVNNCSSYKTPVSVCEEYKIHHN